MLTDRGTTWVDQQKMKLKLHLTKKKNENDRKTKDYIKTMLAECKSWRGPCASVDELQLILRQNPDWSEKNIKTKREFYSYTRKAGKIERPKLIWLNGITIELQNLTILLNKKKYDQSNYC